MPRSTGRFFRSDRVARVRKREKLFGSERLVLQHPKKSRQAAFHVTAVDNKVKETVIENKFGALKAFWKVLANRFADNTRTRKTDQCSGFGNIEITEHCIGGCNTTCCRVCKQRDIWNLGFIEQRYLGGGLSHLH